VGRGEGRWVRGRREREAGGEKEGKDRKCKEAKVK